MTLSEWINNIRWKYFTNQKSGLIFKELMKEFQMVGQMTENKRFEYWKDSDTAYDTKIKYGQYFRIIDKKDMVHLLNEQDKEIKRLKCINRQLEERLDKSIALDMSRCGKYVYGIHGGSND